jgi:hypothetical protein
MPVFPGISRSGAVVICLALLLVVCGPPARDYTLDELVETLVEGAFCAEVEPRGSREDDPEGITLPHGYCANESIPGGLLAATFSSTDERLFGILNLLAPGVTPGVNSYRMSLGTNGLC